MIVLVPTPISFDVPNDPTTAWTLLSLGAPLEPGPSVVGVVPSAFSQEGAVELVITLGGVVSAGDIQVFVDGVPCFGGQGYGYTPITDGTTVTVYSPLLSIKGATTLTVQQGVATSSGFAVSIQERVWRGKQFDIRQSFPPWYDVGARRIDLEDPL